MENIVKTEQLYEGKAKKVFATNNPDYVIVDYKDDATAFNGEKKGTIRGKGVVNNKMTNYMFGLLEKEGIPTHLVKEINDRETIVKKVEIVPLEVIVRNVAAGSFSKKLGIAEGTPLKQPTLEFSYKNDDLGDPFINSCTGPWSCYSGRDRHYLQVCFCCKQLYAQVLQGAQHRPYRLQDRVRQIPWPDHSR